VGPGSSSKQARREVTPEEDNVEEDDSSESDNSDDFELNQGALGGLFSNAEMDYFWGALANVVLPTVIGCIPSQLGKSHCAKLKASQWYVLFVYVIPLIIMEIFVEQIKSIQIQSNQWWIMENITLLIQCTHIINTCRVCPTNTKRFWSSYNKYNESLVKIFEDLKVNPNHHCALHVLEHLGLWGTMGGVAECSGEQCIGKVCGLKTNNCLGECLVTS
jgi:hypothetical protein